MTVLQQYAWTIWIAAICLMACNGVSSGTVHSGQPDGVDVGRDLAGFDGGTTPDLSNSDDSGTTRDLSNSDEEDAGMTDVGLPDASTGENNGRRQAFGTPGECSDAGDCLERYGEKSWPYLNPENLECVTDPRVGEGYCSECDAERACPAGRRCWHERFCISEKYPGNGSCSTPQCFGSETLECWPTGDPGPSTYCSECRLDVDCPAGEICDVFQSDCKPLP